MEAYIWDSHMEASGLIWDSYMEAFIWGSHMEASIWDPQIEAQVRKVFPANGEGFALPVSPKWCQNPRPPEGGRVPNAMGQRGSRVSADVQG